jgi:hypothetical protein
MRHTLPKLRRLLADALHDARYARQLCNSAIDEANEHRRRRLDTEAEIDAMADIAYARRPDRVIYVERTIPNPMPPREIVKRTTIIKREPVYVATGAPIVIKEFVERPAGSFGRLGDRLDAWLNVQPRSLR